MVPSKFYACRAARLVIISFNDSSILILGASSDELGHINVMSKRVGRLQKVVLAIAGLNLVRSAQVWPVKSQHHISFGNVADGHTVSSAPGLP